jgi:hypothetical protein
MQLPLAKPAAILLLFLPLCWTDSTHAQTRSPVPPAQIAETFMNATVDADELADFLGISVWAFAYDGESPRCWVEVTEEGQKTVSQPKIIDVPARQGPNAGGGGKILLFLKPGTIELRRNSRVAREGGGVGLAPDALWWGWKGGGGSTTRLERPVALKAGQEITLLSHEMQEVKDFAKDPKNPRKVRLVLKAAVANEKR